MLYKFLLSLLILDALILIIAILLSERKGRRHGSGIRRRILIE